MNKKIKLGLATMVASLIIAGCQTTANNTTATKELSGIWMCETQFPNGAAIAKEQINFDSTTGEYQSIGQVAFKMTDNTYLPFEQIKAGKWHVSGNEYQIQSYGSQGSPVDENLRNQLQKNQKLQQNLAPILRILNTGAAQSPTTYQIDTLNSANFNYHVQLQDQNIQSNCVKVPETETLPALKQNAAQINNFFKTRQAQAQ